MTEGQKAANKARARARAQRGSAYYSLGRPSIDARAVWYGDARECRELYRQFMNAFGGNFEAIQSYYRWKHEPMLSALRQGRASARAALDVLR